jgi:transcriptional regulator with XRE-family HTH domain
MGGARHSVGDVVGPWRLTAYVTAGCWRAACVACSYEPPPCSVPALRVRACAQCHPRRKAVRVEPVAAKPRDRVEIGHRVGEWECVRAGSGGRVPRWRCVTCSHMRGTTLAVAARTGCARCAGIVGHTAIHRHVEREARDLPDLTRWIAEDSTEAWAWIDATVSVCGPLTQEEIALAIGVTRQRVEQIEGAAVRRLLAECERAGISRQDVAEILAGRSERTEPDHTGLPGAHGYGARLDVRSRWGAGVDGLSGRAALDVRAANAVPESDCEPGEPMAAACLDELVRLERRMRAVHAALDAARELDVDLREAAE